MDRLPMKRPTRGFTLIEVMIAITIMGVLALICWRALDSVANSDQRLRKADAETTTALRILQQFQRDIEMRADDALMNGAVRPADRPQRLLPPSLVSERHPDGTFSLEITRSVGSDGLRWQRVRWWRQGSTLWRASGAAADRYPLPAPEQAKGLMVARDVQQFEVRAWEPGAGWAMLPSEGEVLPATGLELRLGLRDGRGPLSYRRVLEL
ncbi:general secretion pathway protein J [Stenotrophomonas sp. AN71]